MIDIKVPTVGESISEVTLLKWTKQDGDYVERDEVIAANNKEKDKVIAANKERDRAIAARNEMARRLAHAEQKILESTNAFYSIANDKWWTRTQIFRKTSNIVRKIKKRPVKTWPKRV